VLAVLPEGESLVWPWFWLLVSSEAPLSAPPAPPAPGREGVELVLVLELVSTGGELNPVSVLVPVSVLPDPPVF
jgi:hypothetical protein